MKKVTKYLPMALLGVFLVGCDGMTHREQNVLGGAALGAVGGAVIGSFAGSAGTGALIGAGVGGIGGYLYDRNKYGSSRYYYRRY